MFQICLCIRLPWLPLSEAKKVGFFTLPRASPHPSSCRNDTGQRSSNLRRAVVLWECIYRVVTAEPLTHQVLLVTRVVGVMALSKKGLWIGFDEDDIRVINRGNSLVFVPAAAFLQIFEQKWCMVVVTIWCWQLFSKLHCWCWIWHFFLFSRKSLLSELCNFSFYPFVLPVSNIS